MQTFLPYKSFSESARCLDRMRLGKQRVEVLQILNTLKNGSAWRNHPAVKMWQGYEDALVSYGRAICIEWLSRGYKDTCLEKIEKFSNNLNPKVPNWVGLSEFHASHRSNLLRKLPEHYSKFGWTEPPTIEYYWPTKVI